MKVCSSCSALVPLAVMVSAYSEQADGISEAPLYLSEKHCNNWEDDALGIYATIEACIAECQQNAKCVACTIGRDLNNYKAMETCTSIGKRDTYGHKSLWRKEALLYLSEKHCNNWGDDALGDYATMEVCVAECLQNAKCVACTIGLDLNNYKAMETCTSIGKRDTYGHKSLWRKALYLSEKHCNNWEDDALGNYATIEACIPECLQNAKCVACTIGRDLNNYKAMKTCTSIGKRDTYGHKSLWRKEAAGRLRR